MRNNLPQKFHRGNIALFSCATLCLVCYDLFGGLWLKGFTSFWFVLLGFFNLLYARRVQVPLSTFLILIQAGLILGMCADILLGPVFILGILSFAAGHICYLIAFCFLEKISRQDVYIILPIAAVSLFVVTGTPYIRINDPLLKKLLLGYAVIIACMLGKSISNLKKSKTTCRRLIFLGSVMFWFSDVMLAIDMFGTPSRLTWVLCSYNYWPAQTILAYSMYHFINTQRCAS